MSTLLQEIFTSTIIISNMIWVTPGIEPTPSHIWWLLSFFKQQSSPNRLTLNVKPEICWKVKGLGHLSPLIPKVPAIWETKLGRSLKTSLGHLVKSSLTKKEKERDSLKGRKRSRKERWAGRKKIPWEKYDKNGLILLSSKSLHKNYS